MVLGEGNAEPAEIGHLGPHGGAVAEVAALVAEPSLAVHTAVLRNELCRGAGEHFLGWGKDQSSH